MAPYCAVCAEEVPTNDKTAYDCCRQASVNDRIAELEAARLSCEADEDAALRLQEKLARLRATVAHTRCGSSLGQGKRGVSPLDDRDWGWSLVEPRGELLVGQVQLRRSTPPLVAASRSHIAQSG